MPGHNGTVEIGQNREELVYSKQKIRNIRIILLILGVLLFGALIAVLIVLLVNTTEPEQPVKNDTSISLDDILSGTLRARSFNGSWSSGNGITYRHDDKIIELDVTTQRKTTLLELREKLRYSSEHQKSADGKYLLYAREPFKIYRHSFTALYYVLNLETKISSPIEINGAHERLVLAKWSPVGNALILNFNGNLYYKQFALASSIQLTDDADSRIINGIPDWVYEEEVFSSNEAVWFSPNGNKIAYVQFNDIPTHIMNLPFYGESGSLEYQYPFLKSVSYPKAGSPNPFVKCFQIDLNSVEEGIIAKRQPVPVPSELNTDDHIITVVNWLNNDLLLSIWMNRVQNEAYLQVSSELRRYEIYNIKSQTGWVDLFKAPFNNRNGSQIALILPHNQDNKSGDYRHLSLLSTRDKSKPIALTSGKFVVQSILYWDQDTNFIFYMANEPNKSQVLHLYAVKANRGGDKPQCITCSIKENGVAQSYFSASFSKNGKNILISALGPNLPTVGVYQWTANSGNIILKKIMNWESNDNIRKILTKKSLPTTEIHTIDIGDGFSAKILLQLPANLDRSGAKKYPLLVDVYGGPDSYSVVDTWNLDWGSYLVSNRSIIYAKIDGRGSGLRGDKLLHSIYLSLGTAEVNDQINVTRKLQETLPFIDGQHTGIWGWSYGGYASGMALAKDDKSIFKCAASVAPVTDWLYYDSIYTERYMKTPDENKLGYSNSRLSTMAEHFKDKKYLLVHGTLDDNVHYQQAMILAKNLERNDILFKQISYPDEDHGLANVRPHLYHSLDKFFGECFGLEKSKYFR